MVINRSNAIKLYIHAIVLIGWILQSFVPIGFMPKANANSLFEIVICTPNGLETIKTDEGSNHSNLEKSNKCLYSSGFFKDVEMDNVNWLLFFTNYIAQSYKYQPFSKYLGNKPWFSQGPPVYSG
jgi:hypothetical protein